MAFQKKLTELESVRDSDIWRIRIAKDIVKLSTKDVRTVHSALYQAEITAGQTVFSKIGPIIPEKAVEPGATQWAG